MKSKEIALGFFILGALILLTVGFILVKDLRILNSAYTIKASFDFGDGIKTFSPVRIAGVDVGEVEKVELQRKGGKTKVLVYASIKKGVRIPVGSEVFINNLGVLGEKYLEIVPARNSTQYLRPGAIIRGENSVPLYKMGRLAKSIMDDFSLTMAQLKTFISDEQFRSSLYDLVFNLDKASVRINKILDNLQTARGSLGRLLYDDELYEEAKSFFTDIKEHPWKLLYIPREDRIRLRQKSHKR